MLLASGCVVETVADCLLFFTALADKALSLCELNLSAVATDGDVEGHCGLSLSSFFSKE